MQLRNTPEARGLFRAIAGPEGTLKPDGSFAYYRQFGGNDLDPSKLGTGHPNQVIRKGGYSSAATGFAQFMPDTWNMVNQDFDNKLNFKIPEHQEIAALRLAERRGVDIERLKQEGLTPQLVAKLAPEWASFPTLGGGSAYGQPSKSYETIQKLYKEGLEKSSSTNSTSTVSTPQGTSQPLATPTIQYGEDGKSITVTPPGSGNTTVKFEIKEGDEEDSDSAQAMLQNAVAAMMKNTIGGGGMDYRSLLNRKNPYSFDGNEIA